MSSSDESCWVKTVRRHLPLGSNKLFRPRASRWISLLTGAIGIATAASSATFPVWQNAMRATLNQTETDSNFMNQLGTVGFFLGFPAGMMYERFGSQANTIFGASFSSLTFLILGLATNRNNREIVSFFAKHLWLIDVIWFVNGFAGNFMYMAALMPNVDNFPLKRRGKVIGFIDAVCSLGPTLFSVMYNTGFTNGFVRPGQEAMQNLSSFFIILSVINAGIGLLLFLFNGRLNKPQDEEDLVLVDNDQEGEKAPCQFSEFPFSELPSYRLIFRPNFYLVLLQICLISSCQMTFHANISSYLRSFNMSEYNLLFTVMNTSLQAVSKFTAGFVSDFVARSKRAPRTVTFLVPYFLQATAFTICIFYGDNFALLLITCIFVGIAFGAAWCQSPIILGELFGSEHLASNLGWTMLFSGLSGFPFSIGLSAIYEAAIYEPGEIYCYGLNCYKWSFLLLAGASFSAFVAALGLTQNMFRNAKDRLTTQTFLSN